MRASHLFRTLCLAAIAAVPAAAFAQAPPPAPKVGQFVPNTELKGEAAAKGWDGSLTINANVSINHNNSVVGQLDGASFITGGGLAGTLEYRDGPHELMNKLSLTEAFAKTPALADMVKTNDALRIESTYNYYFVDWLGAFARLSLEAPLFQAWDRRAQATDFTITRLDGMVEQIVGGHEVRLAKSFDPLTLTQSIGAVARPFAEEAATMTARLGVGGRETLAAGVLLNTDDAATPAIELSETDNVIQGGAELAVGVEGKLPAQRFNYGVDFGLLLPLLNNDAQDRGALDLLRVALAATLTFSMYEWFGISYQLRLTSDPQLLDDLQVQNALFASITYDLITTAKPEPPPPPPDPALIKAVEAAAASEERAKLAEERAALAEERAKLAEEKAKTPEPAPTPEPTPEPAPVP